ncbi:hypothetical protein [Streptomyces sp. AC512_CC834]|uniref:hypothetical protein n=1 Tax=Streptomyces sp. AC512_CC834 TaxID=2823691 RepID=UPI001C26A22C|nr:hypothetical protein [Streptomyces sp. AC512_CC834]
MAESRQKSPETGAPARALAPPPVLYGFLLLLALMFTVSYAVGSAAGPVSPGMSGSSDTGVEVPPGNSGGGGGGQDTDMGGMG